MQLMSFVLPVSILVVALRLAVPSAQTTGAAAGGQSVDLAAVRSQLTEEEFSEFQRWVAIGPGGLPHTLEGFRTLQRMNRALRDPLDISHLATSIGQPGNLATLKILPERAGSRPTVAPFAVPHRQTTQHNTAPMRERQKAIFDEVVRQHADVVHYQTSYFEAHNQAVFLKTPAQGNQTAVPDTHGEVGHVHPTDGSMHFSLSPSDARDVLLKRWGELHGLAGQEFGGRRLPATYTLVYAPRTDDELAVARQILVAAIRFSALRTPVER